MKKTLYLAAAMVAAQIGAAQAQIQVENVMPEPGRFTQSQAAATCPKLLIHYRKAIVVMNGGYPAPITTAATGQAAEARALALAGGCHLAPFVDAYLAESK